MWGGVTRGGVSNMWTTLLLDLRLGRREDEGDTSLCTGRIFGNTMLMLLVPNWREIVQITMTTDIERLLIALQVPPLQTSRRSEAEHEDMVAIVVLVPLDVVLAVLEEVAPRSIHLTLVVWLDLTDDFLEYVDRTTFLLSHLVLVHIGHLRQNGAQPSLSLPRHVRLKTCEQIVRFSAVQPFREKLKFLQSFGCFEVLRPWVQSGIGNAKRSV